MAVGFMTTCAISAYHLNCCENFEIDSDYYWANLISSDYYWANLISKVNNPATFYWLVWFDLWSLAIFQIYRGGKFYWRRKPEYPEKTTDLPQVTDKLYHTQ
jgi:hypothetical protein